MLFSSSYYKQNIEEDKICSLCLILNEKYTLEINML